MGIQQKSNISSSEFCPYTTIYPLSLQSFCIKLIRESLKCIHTRTVLSGMYELDLSGNWPSVQ